MPSSLASQSAPENSEQLDAEWEAAELPPSYVSRWVLQMSAESPVRPASRPSASWRKPTGWALLALGVGAAGFVATRSKPVRRWLDW